MINDYDAIAPFYDRLARLVFGSSQKEAQIRLLNFLKPGMKVLVVGGGTGWILEEIGKRFPEGLSIWYVEKSGKMLDLSRQRDFGRNEVQFVCSDINDLDYVDKHDAVLTAFLFDNFRQQSARETFLSIDRRLKEGAFWLYTDFDKIDNPTTWQKLLLKTMYLFFRKISNVEAEKLPDIKSLFASEGYDEYEKRQYYNGFIAGYSFRKPLTGKRLIQKI